jgi:hypothetical protein
MPPKKPEVDTPALCLKREALCREAVRPFEEGIASEEARHKFEMACSYNAKSMAYYTQEASNNEELTTLKVDTADIKRSCPVCETPREGDFKECECGVMLGCLTCTASMQLDLESGSCELSEYCICMPRAVADAIAAT